VTSFSSASRWGLWPVLVLGRRFPFLGLFLLFFGIVGGFGAFLVGCFLLGFRCGFGCRCLLGFRFPGWNKSDGFVPVYRWLGGGVLLLIRFELVRPLG